MKQDKNNKREIASNSFDKFIGKYNDELKDFAILFYGSALTLFRDGKMNDTDIDFFVKRDNVKFLFSFILKNRLTVHEMFVHRKSNKISELRVGFNKTYIDFFIVDTYFGIENTVIFYSKGKTNNAKIIIENSLPKNIAIKPINGVVTMVDETVFKELYGSTGRTPILDNDDGVSDSLKNKKIIKNDFELNKYTKKIGFPFRYKVGRNKIK